jgi:hypothetical protein
MITYKKAFLKIGEVWFDSESNGNPVDVMCYRYCLQPKEGAFCHEFYTVWVDLRQDQYEILGNMKKDTRYEIRRSHTRDGLIYESWDDGYGGLLPEFFEFYDKFACQKNLPPTDRSRWRVLAEHGTLSFSRVRKGSATLVYHVFFHGHSRVQLLCSPSLFRGSKDSAYRNLVGRANRYHHWRDMLRFKEAGVSIYGLGGWYAGGEDQARINVNRFKDGFGGTVGKRYECKMGVTTRGKIAVQAQNYWQRVRSAPLQITAPPPKTERAFR